MKNSQKGFAIPLIIAILVILVIGGGVYYYSKNSQSNLVNNGGVETKDWKKYENKELGISFQYPILWKQPIIRSTPKLNSYISFDLGSQSSFDIGITNSYGLTGSNTSIETLAEDTYMNALKQYSDLKSDQKKEDINLSGHKAILISHIFHPAGGKDLTPVQNTSIYISASNNRIITISYRYLLNESAKSQQSIFDKIISSLKLDDSASLVAIDIPLSKNLVGVWQTSPAMAAGWSDHYQFFSSGKYNHGANQMSCRSNERANSGYWKLTASGDIELTMMKKIVLTGETKEDIMGNCDSPQKTIDVQKEVKILTVSECKKSESDNYSCMSISGSQFYKFSDDPMYGNDSSLEKEPVFK